MGDVLQDAIALQIEKWEFDSSYRTTSRANDFPVPEKAKGQLRRELYLWGGYVPALYKIKDGE